jgi:hypothetical protein
MAEQVTTAHAKHHPGHGMKEALKHPFHHLKEKLEHTHLHESLDHTK